MNNKNMKTQSELIIFVGLVLFTEIVTGVVYRALVNDGSQVGAFKPESNLNVQNQEGKNDAVEESNNEPSFEKSAKEQQDAQSEKIEDNSAEKGATNGCTCTCCQKNELSENKNNEQPKQAGSVEEEQSERKENVDNASYHVEQEAEEDFEIIEVGILYEQNHKNDENVPQTNIDEVPDNRENTRSNNNEIYFFTFSPLDR